MNSHHIMVVMAVFEMGRPLMTIVVACHCMVCMVHMETPTTVSSHVTDFMTIDVNVNFRMALVDDK